jgi:hypothetical protein
MQLFATAAKQGKSVQLTAVCFQQRHIEALDLALLLKPGPVLDAFVEDRHSFGFSSPHRYTPTYEDCRVCHCFSSFE